MPESNTPMGPESLMSLSTAFLPVVYFRLRYVFVHFFTLEKFSVLSLCSSSAISAIQKIEQSIQYPTEQAQIKRHSQKNQTRCG